MEKLAIELRKLKLKNKLSREPAETKYIQEDVIKETNPNGIGNIRTQKTLYEPMDMSKPVTKRKSIEINESGPLPKEGDLLKKLNETPSYSEGSLKDSGNPSYSEGSLKDSGDPSYSEDQELKNIKSKLLKYKMMNQEMEDEEKTLTPALDRLYKGRK